MMRVTLLLGFLGAGKTTLLQRILERGVEDERVAVIVNEFGAVGVDGEILAGRALDTIELASGCICCSQKGPMLDAISELAETIAPDRLLIEASGVAQPDDVAEALVSPTLANQVELAPVVTLVDASRFRRMAPALGSFYAAQVTHADIVIINKIDLVTAEEIDAVRADIEALNPHATMIYAERCDFEVTELLDGSSHYQSSTLGPENHSHINTTSMVIDLMSDRRQEDFKKIFQDLRANIWRVKGYALVDGRSHLVQYVPGSLELTPVAPRDRHYLVFIGSDLDRDELSDVFTGAAVCGGEHIAGV